MNWTLQAVAFLPNFFWLLGSKYAGDKRQIGWVLLFVSEIGWVVLSVMAHLYSILPWCILGFVLYWRNWKKWRTTEPVTS
jgi:hypothetical protein